MLGLPETLKHAFEPSLFEPKSALPGNGIFRPETNGPKRRRSSRHGARETKPTRRTHADLGLIAGFREISVRTRMRGGPGRTRTSNQAVMSAVTDRKIQQQTAFPRRFANVCSCLVAAFHWLFIGLGHAQRVTHSRVRSQRLSTNQQPRQSHRLKQGLHSRLGWAVDSHDEVA